MENWNCANIKKTHLGYRTLKETRPLLTRTLGTPCLILTITSDYISILWGGRKCRASQNQQTLLLQAGLRILPSCLFIWIFLWMPSTKERELINLWDLASTPRCFLCLFEWMPSQRKECGCQQEFYLMLGAGIDFNAPFQVNLGNRTNIHTSLGKVKS